MPRPRAAFFTLGCKVNQYESFSMMSQFAARGFEIVEPEQEAEVYVVNSCTVTATGDKKSRQMLRRFRRRNPAAVLVLCGCFPQAFPQEAAAIPEADIVLGSTHRAQVLPAVLKRLEGTERQVEVLPHMVGEPFEDIRAGDFFSRTRAYVKIEDGCERRCSYCIIPTARGPVRSRPLAKLRRELEELGEKGYKEAVLVGINLNCYGLDLGLTLSDAVELACATPGIERVRLGSLEPELLTNDVIARWAALPRLCPQFHLSLQSGCDATLLRMNRHYNTADYREIVIKLRAAFPGCAITTDLMVGFPGETPAEFDQSLAFSREISFARAHVFVYSPRPGTPAAIMPDQVDGPTASLRAKKMAQAMEECGRLYLKQQLSKTLPVLFEQRDEGLWQGYTPCYTLVKASSTEHLAGQIRPVLLTGLSGEGCLGTLA